MVSVIIQVAGGKAEVDEMNLAKSFNIYILILILRIVKHEQRLFSYENVVRLEIIKYISKFMNFLQDIN
jgi:hypothetical protein